MTERMDDMMEITIRALEGVEAPVDVTDGSLKLELQNIGEGLAGDYDPNDPNDVPLLRFYLSRRTHGDWEEVESASRCTMIDARAPIDRQIRHALDMFLAFRARIDRYDEDVYVDDVADKMSWVGAHDRNPPADANA